MLGPEGSKWYGAELQQGGPAGGPRQTSSRPGVVQGTLLYFSVNTITGITMVLNLYKTVAQSMLRMYDVK